MKNKDELNGMGIHSLCQALCDFAKERGLRLQSADEMLADLQCESDPEFRTAADIADIAWLESFIAAWNVAP